MKNQGSQCNQDASLVGMLPESVRHAVKTDLILKKTQQFAGQKGRRPRILVCYIGTSDPKRNLNQIASIFAQWGFDVDIGPVRQTVQHAAIMAIENDVHLVCLVCKPDQYPSTAVELAEGLRDQGCGHILVTVAGDIPADNHCDLLSNSSNLINFNPKTTNEVIALLERLV